MDVADYTVTLSFHLPPVLLLRAPIGSWPQAPRGVTLKVGTDGMVTSSCVNGSELHARGLVMTTAAAFLRAMDRNIPPTVIPAKMSAPSLGDRTVTYAIALGARVSIARTGEAPAVWGNPLLSVVDAA
jgi:hypothetical protein